MLALCGPGTNLLHYERLTTALLLDGTSVAKNHLMEHGESLLEPVPKDFHIFVE